MTVIELEGKHYKLIDDAGPPTATDQVRARTLGALTVSAVLSGAAFGLTALDDSLAAAADIAARVLCITSPVFVIGVHVVAPLADRFAPREQVTTPGESLARQRLRPDPVVRKRGEPRPPANDGRRTMQEFVEQLARKRRAKNSLDQAVEPVQAQRDDWDVQEFYDTLTAIWPEPTQANFRQQFGAKDGRVLYTIYVGPKNGDVTCWGDVGVWKQWRVLRQVDGRGKCDWAEWVRGVDDILAMNARLRRYARQRGWDL